MARVSNYTRTRIELLHKQGLHPVEIFKLLKGEGLLASFASVTRIIKKFKLTGSVADVARSGRPMKLSEEARGFNDDQMRKDDEMTSGRIKKKLERRGVTVSSSTVRRARKQLGWTLQQTAYCQLIRNVNKEKRLAFAQSVIENADTFENVIFSERVQFPSSNIAVPVTEKLMSPPSESLNPSIPSRFMSGLGSVNKVPQRFASLMVSWMLNYSAVSWRAHLSRLSEKNFPTTDSPRTMTRSIRPEERKTSTKSTISTGGVPLRKVPTLIQSRTYGMNSSSTWRQRSSHATRKNLCKESRSSGQEK